MYDTSLIDEETWGLRLGSDRFRVGFYLFLKVVGFVEVNICNWINDLVIGVNRGNLVYV